MSTVTDIAEAQADGFDALREELFGVEAKLHLFTPDGDVVATVERGWTMEFSEFHDRFTFLVVPPDEDFGALLRDTARPRLKVVDTNNQALAGLAFRLTSETRPPFGAEQFWRLRVEQEEA